ncbi:MAG: hypothetical protein JWR61_2765 [Ferruginibacter sp.]|uniref:outer membrane beta-barrel protein n=1 Tax=Ferruginibacter sp. TaxID=1940288 RepID=UPI0026589366|nr:outer membrane beta-barrel protein [Ferruginibacter sp.]MDB5277810.1 hypothetical protein [Ferruginibacter sp.]
MKKLFTLMVLALICTAANAQNDSTKTDSTRGRSERSDTIRIGNIVIITNGANHRESGSNTSISMERRRHKKLSNISTNWGIVDLGFANYTDKTNYIAATAAQNLVNAPGSSFPLGAGDFKLRAAKSVDVNLWLFMQRLNLIQHHVNLKYGLGLELNNYRFRSNISFKEPGISPYSSNVSIPNAYVIRDSISFSKNKLAADYITVPLMLNFATNPGDNKKGVSLSAGISAGYLYGQRNKQISSQRGKQKNKGDYDLEQFKLSYIAEIGLGPVRLYGSYSPKSIFKNQMDMRPYTLGIRLSNW